MIFRAFFFSCILLSAVNNTYAQKIVENGINKRLVGFWTGTGDILFNEAKYSLNFTNNNELKIIVARKNYKDLSYTTNYYILSRNMIKVDFFWPRNGPDTLLYWIDFNEKYLEIFAGTSSYDRLSGTKNQLKNSSFYCLIKGDWDGFEYLHLKESFYSTSIKRYHHLSDSVTMPMNWENPKSSDVGYTDNTIWIHHYIGDKDKILGYLFENDRLYLGIHYITLRKNK